MAKTEKETAVALPTVFITSQKMAEDIMNIAAAKQAIATYAELCKDLVIDSAATEAKATEMLTDLNKVIKVVEKKHEIAKKPYLEAGRFCDNIKKDILGSAQEVIVKGKKGIADYREIVRKEAEAAAQKKLEEAQAAVVVSEEHKEEHIDSFTDQINAVYLMHNEAIATCGMTKTIDELKEWHMKYSSADSVFKNSLAPDFEAMLVEIRKEMIKIKDLRKSWFAQPARTAADWKATQKEFLSEADRYHQIALRSIDSKDEIIGAQVTLEAAKIEAEIKPEGRFKWDYDVWDSSQVPLEWMMIDTVAVQNYIAQNKNTIVDGEIVNGVKFIKKEIVVLR